MHSEMWGPHGSDDEEYHVVGCDLVHRTTWVKKDNPCSALDRP